MEQYGAAMDNAGGEAHTGSMKPLALSLNKMCLACRGGSYTLLACDSAGAAPKGLVLIELPEGTCDDCSLSDSAAIMIPCRLVARMVWKWSVGCCTRGSSTRMVVALHEGTLKRFLTTMISARASGNAQATVGGRLCMSTDEVDEWLAHYEALPAIEGRADVTARLKSYAFDLHWIAADLITMNPSRIFFLDSVSASRARTARDYWGESFWNSINTGLYGVAVLPAVGAIAAGESLGRFTGGVFGRVLCCTRGRTMELLTDSWPHAASQVHTVLWHHWWQSSNLPVHLSARMVEARLGITPLAITQGVEKEKVALSSSAALRAATSIVFGTPFLAYEMPAPTLAEDGSFKLDISAHTRLVRLGYSERRLDSVVREAMKAETKSIKLTILKDSGYDEDLLKQMVAEKELLPAGFRIMPGAVPMYAAASCFNNEVHALRVRHLPDRPQVPRKVQEAFKQIGLYYREWFAGRMKGPDGKQVAEAAITSYIMDPKNHFSSKWSPERKERALVEASLATIELNSKKPRPRGKKAPEAVKGADPEHEYAGLRRSIAIKVNELLTKEKPRGILSTGDAGCAVHVFGPGLLEALLYHLKDVEARSVKHSDGPNLGRRFAKLYLDSLKETKWFISFDFGAFDASVRLWIRMNIENELLREITEMLNLEIGEAAQKDRDAWVTKLTSNHDLRVETTDSCRQSGDRGTSVLNYVTNTSVNMFASFVEDCEGRGLDWEKETGTLRDHVQRWLNREFPQDVIAEGDDNWPCVQKEWASKAVTSVRSQKFFARITGGTLTHEERIRSSFLFRWVNNAAKAGFALEPQDARGRVPIPDEDESPIPYEDAKRMSACLNEWCGRHEFVSRLFVPVEQDKKWTFVVVPKPRKALDSLTASFRRPSCLAEELKFTAEKALALMAASIGSTLNFAVARAVYLAASQDIVELASFRESAGDYTTEMMIKSYGEFTGTWYSEVCRRDAQVAHHQKRIIEAVATELGVQADVIKKFTTDFNNITGWGRDVPPLERIKNVSELVSLLLEALG